MATTTPTSTAPDAGAGRDRRLLKGALFGAAGLALLVGGGTFALWNDSDILPGGDVDTGDLTLELTGTPAWTLNGAEVTDLSTVLLVPEDELVLTQTLTLDASGTTLTADLDINVDALDADLVDNLTVTESFTTVPGMTADGTITGPVDIEAAPITATVTIVFDADGQDQQDATIALSDITFTLQQTTA